MINLYEWDATDMFTSILRNPHHIKTVQSQDSERNLRAPSDVLISEFSEGYGLRKKIYRS